MNIDIEILRNVHAHLRMHITTVSTFPVFDSESINSDIESYIIDVNRIVKDSANLNDEATSLLKAINGLTRALYYMIDERVSLQKKISKKSSPTTERDLDDHRSHRLSSFQLMVLESWYKFNRSYPYLKLDSLSELVGQTGLSEVQVRNWISNRRRKEKSMQISEELVSLLTSTSGQHQ